MNWFSCFRISHSFAEDVIWLFLSLLQNNLLILLQSTLWPCKSPHFCLINLYSNYEVMKLLFWIFWSARNPGLFMGCSLDPKCDFLPFKIYSVADYPFCASFSRGLPAFTCWIWRDKSRILNNSLFIFKNKAIRLALQFSLNFFFFAAINNIYSK